MLMGREAPSQPRKGLGSCAKIRGRHGDVIPWKCLNATAGAKKKPYIFSKIEIEAVQQQRQKHLRRVCREIYPTSPFDLRIPPRVQTLRHLYVNDDYNLTVTIIRKAGSTNLKKFMRDLHAISGEEYQSKWPALQLLHYRSEGAIMHALKRYTKVLFVRNPLVRLLSAFRDKFVKLPTRVYVKMANSIVRRVRRQRPDLTFAEFLAYIAAVKGRNGDPHWAPVFRASRPCPVRYDFIGKLETLPQDTDYLIDKLGVKGHVEFDYPKPFTESSNTTRLLEYFSHVPPEIVEKICSVYQDDFIAFDYPDTRRFLEFEIILGKYYITHKLQA